MADMRPGAKVYVGSYTSTDFDIGTPLTFVITTPSTGSWCFAPDIKTHQTLSMTIDEGVTIGAAGTAVPFRNLNRGATHPEADSECLLERGGTYTGGTEIYDGVELRTENAHVWTLKQDTSYLITLTSKADDNYTCICFKVWS